MTGAPFAHVAGIPVEETLAMYGAALLLMGSAATATIGIRVRRIRERRRARRHPSDRHG